MTRSDAEKAWVGILEPFVDREIENLEKVVLQQDQLQDIPLNAWLTDRLVKKWEHFLLGNLLAHITWLVLHLEENNSEIEVGELDSSVVRQLAKELVENKREDLEAALTHPEQR